MGEGAYSKPTSLGRYIVFYAILLYYVAFCSVSTIHFVFPFTLRVMHIGWLIFVDKRWNVLAILLCLAAFVRYIFSKSNKEYSTEAEDLLSQYMAFEQPSYTPFLSPSSEVDSSLRKRDCTSALTNLAILIINYCFES
ncbi:unnamed protein product [Brassica napus]|uniref:(rape) hypothetical protein n=1 Tax=Brassica napus TaxID=3708 RepID=A0A816MHZ6_BRANA|nr:unnamed protein product [Brassica napus]